MKISNNEIVICLPKGLSRKEAEKAVSNMLDDIYLVEEQERARLDKFITNYTEVAKALLPTELHKVVSAYADHMLKKGTMSDKVAFYRYHSKCVEEGIDDFLGVALEFQKLSLDKVDKEEK